MGDQITASQTLNHLCSGCGADIHHLCELGGLDNGVGFVNMGLEEAFEVHLLKLTQLSHDFTFILIRL